VNLDFLGDGLLRTLAGQFGELFVDRGLCSLSELEIAAELEPDVSSRHLDLGRRMLQDAKPEMARQAFARALRLDPDHLFARVGLACAFEAMDMTQTAIDELHNCLEERPGYQPAIVALEYCLQKLGDGETSDSHLHSLEVLSVG
jgi:hypothetical protein